MHMRFIRMLALIAAALSFPFCADARDLIVTQTIYAPALPAFQLVSITPADNSVITGSPLGVSFAFSQMLLPEKSTVKLYDPYNNPMEATPVVSNANLSIAVPQLLTGKYRVEWQAQCKCTENSVLSGVMHFTVQ